MAKLTIWLSVALLLPASFVSFTRSKPVFWDTKYAASLNKEDASWISRNFSALSTLFSPDEYMPALATRRIKGLLQSGTFDWLELNSSATLEVLSKSLDAGFPRKLNPRALQKNHNKIHAVVLGGSSSARPANKCTMTSQEDPTEGRYSNLLELKLRAQGLNATIDNMAHGSTNSVWNGMVLDQLLDVSDDSIDLIIWEYAINDYAPSSRGDEAQMLQFWLTRIESLYVRARKSPPPILLVYLWRYHIGMESDDAIMEKGAGYSNTNETLAIVDQFNDNGLQIGIMNVGQIITPSVFVKQKRQVLDDVHHPGCYGNRIIADLLQYTIYSNMLLAENATECRRIPVDPTQLPSQDGTSQEPLIQLFDILTSSKAVFGTYMHWEPKLPGPSISRPLVTTESAELATVKLLDFADGDRTPGRHDTKEGLLVPICGTEVSLQLTLTSPDWEWLCVAYAGPSIVMAIDNGVPQRFQGNGYKVSKMAKPINMIPRRGTYEWIDLRHIEKSTNASKGFQLSFCDETTAPVSSALIHFMVGVALERK